MAALRHKKKTTRRRTTTTRRRTTTGRRKTARKAQIPLTVLKKRLKKLENIVERRS